MREKIEEPLREFNRILDCVLAVAMGREEVHLIGSLSAIHAAALDDGKEVPLFHDSCDLVHLFASTVTERVTRKHVRRQPYRT